MCNVTGMVTRKAKLADFSQNQISEYVFYVCSVKAVLLHELLKEQNDKSERKNGDPSYHGWIQTAVISLENRISGQYVYMAQQWNSGGSPI